MTDHAVEGGQVDAVAAHPVPRPEFDVRQMLTVSRGYSVVELLVGEESGLSGVAIQDSGLRAKDIVVLSLSRDGKIIPNPRGTREMAVGDRLLCYGKMSNMKDLLPPRIKKRQGRKLRPIPS